MTKEEFEKKLAELNKQIQEKENNEKEQLKEQSERLISLLPQIEEDLEKVQQIGVLVNKISVEQNDFYFNSRTGNMRFIIMDRTKEGEGIKAYIIQEPPLRYNNEDSIESILYNPYRNQFEGIGITGTIKKLGKPNSIFIKQFCDNYLIFHKEFSEWLDEEMMNMFDKNINFYFNKECRL